MANVSISEAARLTGKSRTTLHRLIKAGELSTCRGERNAKMLETSELLRVFGAFAPVSVEQAEEQVSGQRDTVTSDRNEQVIYILKQEIEHLNTLLASKDSHIDSLKQAMLLLENREEKRQNTTRPRAFSNSHSENAVAAIPVARIAGPSSVTAFQPVNSCGLLASG